MTGSICKSSLRATYKITEPGWVHHPAFAGNDPGRKILSLELVLPATPEFLDPRRSPRVGLGPSVFPLDFSGRTKNLQPA